MPVTSAMTATAGTQPREGGSSESLYLGGRYAEILEFLCSECAGASNVKVLVSEPGLGKTFLLQAALARMQSTARTAFLFWTQLQPDEFVRSLLLCVGAAEITAEVESAQRQFEAVLEDVGRDGKRFVLAIDEAQNLGPPLLDKLATVIDRGLARTPQLRVILAALPTFEATLTAPGASRVRERVAGRMSIPPLTAEQATEYIHHRLRRVTGELALSQEVVARMVARSNGVPRIITGLCDRIVYEALRTKCREIDPAMLNRVLATESLAPSPATNTIDTGQAVAVGTKSASSAEAARKSTASKDQVCAQAPASVPESNVSEPGFLIRRICNWFSSQSGEWSGTAAELGIASGILHQPLPELLQASADELRRFGIAARVERRPGRPRTLRLSRLYTDVRASCTE